MSRNLSGQDRRRRKAALVRRDGKKCSCCHRTDLPLTLDHVTPVCRGGSNKLSNLQLLCEPCNQAKADS